MNSRENMGALGSRIANMGQTLMQAAIRTGVAAGVSAAAAHIEEEHQKEAKERTDRRLHNTRLLLKNYRLLKRHTAGAIYNAKQAKEKESAARNAPSLFWPTLRRCWTSTASGASRTARRRT